ncbi:hypothetical protein [Niveispirillum sp. KHB5.9]|uniref:hypothetical protein n=1 Tax=Niveispirillum sp. KHB5.9 TaxID=3400269 RepID=UPI003A879CB6
MEPTTLLLLYFVVPVWFLAGFADWLCHRATDIEHTAGPKESLLHLLMYAEVAVPLLACLFLDINALVILTMIAAFLLHEATALWDVSYAVSRRVVTPLEQHVHSFLEMVPLMAILLVLPGHWDQFLALFGFGPAEADFSLSWKDRPLSAAYLVTVLAAAFLVELLPYLEELRRGMRVRRARRP